MTQSGSHDPQARARQSRRLRVSLLVMAVHGIVFAMLAFAAPDSDKAGVRLWYETVAFLPLQVVAAIALLVAAGREQLATGTRRALRWMAAGFAAVALGTVISIISALLGQRLDYVSWADLVYYQLYPMLMMGTLALPASQRAVSRARLALDTSIVVMAFGVVIVFALVFDAASTRASGLDRAIVALYSTAQLVTLLFVNRAVERAHRTPSRGALNWLFAALVLSVVGDLVFQMMYSTGYRGPNWSRATSIAANLAMIWAAIRFFEDPVPRAGSDAAPVIPFSPLPIIAVTAIALMVLWLWSRGSANGVEPLIAGILALNLALVARDMVSARDAAAVVREDAYRSAEQRLDAMVRHASDSLLLVDASGQLLFASAPAGPLFGTESERLAGQSLLGWVVDRDRRDFEAFLARLVAPSAGPDVHTWRLRRPDGSERTVESAGLDLRHESSVGGLVLNARDTTERARAGEALRASELRYERLVANISDALIVDDVDGRVVYGNDRFLELSGFSRDDLASLTLDRFFAPEYHAEILERHDRRIAGEAVAEEFESEMMRKDGARLWVNVRVSQVVEAGAVVGTQALIRDVSGRKRAEQLLAESERRFRAVFDQSPVVVVLVDVAEQRIAEVNVACERMFGIARDEMIGRRSDEMDLWADPADRVAYLEVFRAHGHLTGREVRLRRRNGNEFTALLSVSNITIGGRWFSLNTLLDISEQKRAERDLGTAVAALTLSVSLLEATLESTADGILVVAHDRTISRFNKRFTDMWRIPADILESRDDAKAIGYVLSQLKDPAGFMRTVEDLYAAPDAESSDTLEFIDGRVFERYSRPQFVNGRSAGRVWSFRDVSARRSAELAQRTLEAHLRQTQKLEAVGTLAGGIAHDFNNILTAIVGCAEIARSDLPADSPVQAELEQILLASERAATLVRQILAFSRPEPGRRSLLRLDGVVRETMALMRSSLPATVEIVMDLPESGPSVSADATQVQQALMNLCTNAWHATTVPGARLTIRQSRVEIGADVIVREGFETSPGPFVKLSVTDNGSGIDPAVLPRIFDPFFSTKARGEGTGLGLAMVRGIMQAHGGGVSVSSTLGVGTTFDLYFPLAHGAATAADDDAPPPRGHGEHILFVDDEAPITTFGARSLERLGYRVTAVGSGAAALDVFRAHASDFAAVITDLTMPQMTGIVLAQRLRAVRPDIPVVICTGYADAETEQRIHALGNSELLPKPPTTRAFAETLSRILRGSSPAT